MSHTTEESGFARVGSTHPLGAFDAQLERINMHTQTIDILRGQAACNGLTCRSFLGCILSLWPMALKVCKGCTQSACGAS